MGEGLNNLSRSVEINARELAGLKAAKALLMRRVKAEQIEDPVQRLQQLAVVRVDTLHWLKRNH